MKNIYVVVHPEATHHVDGLVGGWFDSGLTARGSGHAADIAERLSIDLRGKPVEVFTSDLRRAHHTAEVIADRVRATVRLDAGLREKSYGQAEGKPQSWLAERRRPIPESGERLRHDEGIPGAETRMDLAVRAYAAMKRIQESPGEHQVVVTHGGTTTLLIAAWIGMPIDAAGRAHFQVSPGSISLLRKDSRNFSHGVARLNNVDHLR